jgi:hypothetical protein
LQHFFNCTKYDFLTFEKKPKNFVQSFEGKKTNKQTFESLDNKEFEK